MLIRTFGSFFGVEIEQFSIPSINWFFTWMTILCQIPGNILPNIFCSEWTWRIWMRPMFCSLTSWLTRTLFRSDSKLVCPELSRSGYIISPFKWLKLRVKSKVDGISPRLLGQSGRFTGIKLDGLNDWNWTAQVTESRRSANVEVLKSKSGKKLDRP